MAAFFVDDVLLEAGLSADELLIHLHDAREARQRRSRWNAFWPTERVTASSNSITPIWRTEREHGPDKASGRDRAIRHAASAAEQRVDGLLAASIALVALAWTAVGLAEGLALKFRYHMHADHALGLVARPDLALDKQLQHRGDRVVLGLGDLLEARMRLGGEADSHTRTGGRVGVRHASYLHQSDAPFKGDVVLQQERSMLTLDFPRGVRVEIRPVTTAVIATAQAAAARRLAAIRIAGRQSP